MASTEIDIVSVSRDEPVIVAAPIEARDTRLSLRAAVGIWIVASLAGWAAIVGGVFLLL